MQKSQALEYLKKHNIEYVLTEHNAVFTCDDESGIEIPGQTVKNLFLRNKDKSRFMLYILPADKRADLKAFAKEVGASKLSFGSPEYLMDKLKITPGSVSPLCLINDPDATVEVFVDKDAMEAPAINCHPNDNAASVTLSNDMFKKLLETLPHSINVY